VIPFVALLPFPQDRKTAFDLDVSQQNVCVLELDALRGVRNRSNGLICKGHLRTFSLSHIQSPFNPRVLSLDIPLTIPTSPTSASHM